ncbi:MAG: selenocysteine-specific translation elongation factor [Dehalococcoidia bacterium]
MFVIGTAGHIDHGKSTLVHALTGIDPDRLQEEKSRGMTIDLGFAWLRLPNSTDVSIIDVPGHERFIKNMLAGVGGIDLALLVVAADEGVMPQTREHLAIVDLLGITSGVVAVTKCDLVDDDWIDLVTGDVEEALKDTRLAGAPLVQCSATTREGLDHLLETLQIQLTERQPKRDIGRPRLAIDRAFTIAGFGTVVTGTLIDGSLRLGQEVEIVPSGLRSRVRGLQTHRTKVEVARPGSRVAVNLPGISTDDVRRGQVVTVPGWLVPATAIDIRLEAVRDLPRPLRHNMTVTFHTGAAEVTGKLRLLDRDELPAGEHGWGQIRLEAPLATVRGDRFVIRSSNATLGGGRVVDTRARRHRRHHAPTLQTLISLSEGTPEDALVAIVDRLQPITIADLGKHTELDQESVRELVASLVSADRFVRLGDDGAAHQALLYTRPSFESLTEAARDALHSYFREHPLRSGMPREEIKSRLRLQTRPFNALLARWLAEGDVTEAGSLVSLAGHEIILTPAQERESSKFISDLAAQPFAPQPSSMPNPELLAYLTEQERVVPVADGVIFAPEAYRRMVADVTEHLRQEGTITLAQVRDMFSTSRKYAQALLEHLDERRITRRIGDERVLR